MAARSRARLLAPVALVATIVVTILVVEHGLGGRKSGAAPTPQLTGTSVRHRHSSSSSRSAPRTTTSATTTSATTPSATAATYVVKSGDSFSAISAKTGVPLATLEALNPGVDPRALHTGQHLRLRP